jgi:predicted amidohydrolase
VAEACAAPATIVAPVVVVGAHVGILVCVDAYTPQIARRLQEQGAQPLESPATWGPWPHEPGDAWKQCSYETGFLLIFCSSKGADQTLDFTLAESVVVKDGARLLAFHSPHCTLVLVNWDLREQQLVGQSFLTMDQLKARPDESDGQVYP